MARTNAFNVNRLKKYNFQYISIEEVIVLEHLLAYYQKKLMEIITPVRIECETGLKRSKINYALDELENKGLISVIPKKIKGKYVVNIDAIVSQIDKLLVKPNKFTVQYFLYIQNPNAFKTHALKAKRAKAMAKTKNKQPDNAIQMSLF